MITYFIYLFDVSQLISISKLLMTCDCHIKSNYLIILAKKMIFFFYISL